MVTSENLLCARAIALKAGLINKQLALEEHVCVDGEYFNYYTGGIKEYYDEFEGV
jgi:hypothetical protein